MKIQDSIVYSTMTDSERIAMDKICRFCNNNLKISSELITACRCKPIHRACLDKYRYQSNNPESLKMCDICESSYQIEINEEKTIYYKTKLLFAFYIFRDISLIFVILLGTFLGCAYLSTQLFGPVKSNTLFPTFYTIFFSLLFTIILLFVLFGFYIIVSYILLCYNKEYKPYWLDLFLNFSVITIKRDYYNCADDNYGNNYISCFGIILFCVLCCWCVIIVEFVINLIIIFGVHFKNLYKNSHYYAYRVKNLENMIYQV